MTLLFKEITLKQSPKLLKSVFMMAFEHGKNLGLFVFLYKGLYKMLDLCLGKHSFNHFLSGLIFGGLIFGKQSGVNHQIVLYLLSRIMIGFSTWIYNNWLKKMNKQIKFIENGYGYYLLAAICWGVVMWLFE